jgi:hypothetical protein
MFWVQLLIGIERGVYMPEKFPVPKNDVELVQLILFVDDFKKQHRAKINQLRDAGRFPTNEPINLSEVSTLVAYFEYFNRKPT